MQFPEDQKQYSVYGSEKIRGNFDTRPSHSGIVGLQPYPVIILSVLKCIIGISIIYTRSEAQFWQVCLPFSFP